MAVRKQRKMKSLKGRVVRIQDKQHWDRVIDKLGSRLMLVHFSAAWNSVCQRFRPVLLELSQRAQFKHVVFAELDMGTAPEVADAIGVDKIPTFQAWRNGECVEEYVGGVPMKVVELLEKHAGERLGGESKRPWLQRILTGLLVASLVAAAGYIGFRHFTEPANSPARLRNKLQDVEARMKAVRKARAVAERKKRAREVAATRRELAELTQEAEVLRGKLQAETRAARDVGEVGDGEDEDGDVTPRMQHSNMGMYSDSDDDQ
ncbi:hypothetical protein WJX72_002704 [[Myrmecia] bisecta]|uniref:Thioredoxin domain-containing protein n=1 Tax=[Myrmecia] bisecta TaxID=41462 RepID=A0AAW1QQM4_9CHLO